MELTRRDALAALSAGAAGVAGCADAPSVGESGPGGPSREPGPATDATDTDDEPDVDALVAVAQVVYPDAVSGIGEFVETYVAGRTRGRPGYRAEVADTVALLDDLARQWADAPVAELDAERREGFLRATGCQSAEPDPHGTEAERIRYYVVNELLYALYASPTGGRLVGIENPQGYPGGTDSYARGPGE